MNNPLTQSDWFSTYNQTLTGRANVFAIPYSGAGTSVYHSWAQTFRASPLDFIGVQLPGRENRSRETAFTDIKLLTPALLYNMLPVLDKPYILFGHSMGALLAFELCCLLHKQQLPLPKALFVSAFRSPELPNPNQVLHDLPEKQIIRGLRKYAGTPDAVLKNPELMAFFLPLLRADFRVHENYSYQPWEPLPCKICALSGSEDSIARPETLNGWAQHSNVGFEHTSYTGGHFFLFEHSAAISRQFKDVFAQT